MGSCAFSVDMDAINNPSGPLITHASNLFNFSKLLFVTLGTLTRLSTSWQKRLGV